MQIPIIKAVTADESADYRTRSPVNMIPVPTKTGISDGRNTEVSGEGLTEGMAVITDQRTGAAP